jgi:hypothetical protein
VGKARKPTKAAKAAKPKANLICIAMVLCDQVVIGKDNTATLVRLVDSVSLPPDATPKDGDFIHVGRLTLFICLKPEDSTGGTAEVMVISVDPSGKRAPIGTAIVNVENSPASGVNLTFPTGVCWGGDGLYSMIAKTPVLLRIATEAETNASH